MNAPVRTTLAACLCLLLCGSASAAQTGTDLVKATLIADSDAIRAGQPFRVAVQFEIEPNWHIYWSNPGETGQATKVSLQLPAGFTASDIEYPTPRRFVAAGDIVGYGYEDEAVLMATITPPATLADNSTQNLSAAVSWLVCSEDLCLPGKQTVSLSLPVKAEPQPANEALFEKWMPRVPVPVGKDPAVAASESRVSDDGETLTFTVDWNGNHTPKAVDWFPAAIPVVSFEDIEVGQTGNQSTITVSTRVLAGQTLPEGRFASVISYEDAAGEPRGIVVPFELKPSQTTAGAVSRRDQD